MKIVRSDGKWFVNYDDGSQAIYRFFNTLEEAKEAAKEAPSQKREVKDDPQREGRILREVREGKELGRTIQKSKRGRKQAKASRVF